MNQQQNVSLKDTTAIVCEECSHDVFTQKYLLRSLSRFVTGSPQDAMIPVPIFECSKCGHVNKDFLPPKEEK